MSRMAEPIGCITQALREIRRIETDSVDIKMAQTYARAGLTMWGESLKGQIPYILSNLGGWRGERARVVKQYLKDFESGKVN